MPKLSSSIHEIERNLTAPPQSVEELLGHLEDMECYLSTMEANLIVMKYRTLSMAPIRDILLNFTKHPDDKVQVAAVACLVHFIKCTSAQYSPPVLVKCPAPYDRMEDMFKPIVAALVGLGDMWSPLFAKRFSILDSLEACKPCLVMMLDCDGLIEKMFETFLNSVRDSHPRAVVSAMHSIMSFVLEVSDDEMHREEQLVPLLLDVIFGEKRENFPAAAMLAGTVLESCTSEKIKLQQAKYVNEVVLKKGNEISPEKDNERPTKKAKE